MLQLSTVSRVTPTNGGLFVSTGRGEHPQRRLSSFELIFVRSGKLELWEGSDIFRLRQGATLILWPNCTHGPLQPYDHNTAFYWVHFDVPTPRSRPGPLATAIPQSAILSRPLRLLELFHRYLDDQENGFGAVNYQSALLKLMLFEIAEQGLHQSSERNAAWNLAVAAQLLISKRFPEPVGTATIAGELKCNADYLGRIFRRTYGVCLTDALHGTRMRHAKNLLLLTSSSLKEVAVRCGYRDENYFRRIFRRHFDMLPGEFRTLHLRRHTNAV